MIENSSADLVMLGAEVAVTVTRQEHHQSVLSRYPVAEGQQRRVAVTLGWCTVILGKYGVPAIEVRLDGQRVGELTHLMSQRYAPVVARVTAREGKPGCEATIQQGTKGLEVVLRLPRAINGVVPMPRPARTTTPTSCPTQTMTPAPEVPVSPAPPWRRGLFQSHLPILIAAAVIAVAFFGAMVNTKDGSPPPLTTADNIPTTTPPPTTTTQPTTTLATTTATIAPTPAPKPKTPPPHTPKTTTTKQTTSAPILPPVATSLLQLICDPNYSGCVPMASDVDCLGGSVDDGPAYAVGPIRVIGTDIYRLDTDHDGIACE
jgi:hypothetical protein